MSLLGGSDTWPSCGSCSIRAPNIEAVDKSGRTPLLWATVDGRQAIYCGSYDCMVLNLPKLHRTSDPKVSPWCRLMC